MPKIATFYSKSYTASIFHYRAAIYKVLIKDNQTKESKWFDLVKGWFGTWEVAGTEPEFAPFTYNTICNIQLMLQGHYIEAERAERAE